MSRKFGKLLCSIWADDDFLDLSDQAKVLYTAFISSPDITPAGVLALTERRWRRYVKGGVASVSEAIDELESARFVVVDDDTAEVWVRAFIKVDDRLSNGNLRASVIRSVRVIHSQRLMSLAREAVERELPGQTPFEGPSDVVGHGDAEGDRDDGVAVHEPASSNAEPRTENNNQQAASGNPVVASAARIYALHRAILTNPRNPEGFIRSLVADELALNGEAARAFVADHPAATARQVAAGVWGLTSGQLDQVERHHGGAA